jgi:hypothetical protein
MPQFPLRGANANAEQLAPVPPLEPLQFHVHGPEPLTDDGVPVEQRLVEGADDTLVPFADPHLPLTTAAAEQFALVPPLEPLQVHVHGREPVTDDDVPVKQRLVEGADDTLVPFADPHVPLTAAAALTVTFTLATGDVPPAPAQVNV